MGTVQHRPSRCSALACSCLLIQLCHTQHPHVSMCDFSSVMSNPAAAQGWPKHVRVIHWCMSIALLLFFLRMCCGIDVSNSQFSTSAYPPGSSKSSSDSQFSKDGSD